MYGLITNNHVLNSELLNDPNFEFNIILKKINKEITYKIRDNLKYSKLIFTCQLIDITFIQFNETLIEQIGEDNFLIQEDIKESANRNFILIQYPKGFGPKFSIGKIDDIHGFNYIHTCSTDGGSSGSPLLSENLKVIGVHKGASDKRNNNIATRFSIIDYAIRTLYTNKNVIDVDILKNEPKKLSEKEEKVLMQNQITNEIYKLKKTYLESYTQSISMFNPYIYKILQFNDDQRKVLLFRTNYAWYWTTIYKDNLNLKDISDIRMYEWNIIKFDDELDFNDFSDHKLDHREEIIIKLYDFIYIRIKH